MCFSFPFVANFPSLSLLQRHSVFHLHSCCEARPSARHTDYSPTPSLCLRHSVHCFFMPWKWRILTHQRNINTFKQFKFAKFGGFDSKWILCWGAAETLWTVAVGLPLRLLPDFMREKWTQAVIGSLVFLYTCRLLWPHNCVIQVACQSCERSSQAHVDAGLIYIVAGETKTAQPKWNVWIVLSHWIHCAKSIPPEGSTLLCLSS